MPATTYTPIGTSYAELNAVLDRAARPSHAPIAITDDQLVALQVRWATALSARLDQAIESAGPEPMTEAVAAAWHRLAADQPVLRAVLDRAEPGSTELDAAQAKEFEMLALATGLAGLDDPTEQAVAAGRSFRQLIRPTAARAA
ncbi:MAG TPA: hypothetical protein VGH89_30700 [Pseudonocardia sp.]|jgi:hypothetical protein